MSRIWTIAGVLGLLLGSGLPAGAAPITRAIPRPLPSHPGNIFVAGEQVSVAAPAGGAETWRATDYEGRTAAEGRVEKGRAELGKLPVGYYELAWAEGAGSNRVTVGVVEPLRAPTPLSSPIAIDVAMAWFFPKEERMAAPANLCTLAGINWVRDRLLVAGAGAQARGVRPEHPLRGFCAGPGGCGLAGAAGRPRLGALGQSEHQALPAGPAGHPPVLSRDGPALAGAGAGDRAVERSGHRGVRRPHRQRDGLVAEGGLPRA